MPVGERIKELRTKQGLTQAELAKRSNVAKITIQQYEYGKRQPRVEQLERIANALQVELSDLLGITKGITAELDEVEKERDYWQSFLKNHNEAELDAETLKKLRDFEQRFSNVLHEAEHADNMIFDRNFEDQLLYYFWKLNDDGKRKAIERTAELTEIQRYQE